MRTLLFITLLVILALPLFASAESTIPLPTPQLSESTIIQGTGWSAAGNHNEALACELAHNRAIKQLKHGITVAHDKQLVSPEEFSLTRPLQISRTWHQETGRCTITMQLIVPVLPKYSTPVVHERRF